LSADEFRSMFRGSPVKRTKYSGFLRNVAMAMGNSGDAKFRQVLERLAAADDETVAEAARWALDALSSCLPAVPPPASASSPNAGQPQPAA
jgi:epoxyqueuosine reductase